MASRDPPGGSSSAQRYTLGDWVVDPAGCRIAADGATVHLEPKVMEVLAYLVSHQGQLVTREALEQDVWRGALVGYDSVTGSIIKLRKALGDDARNPQYIETVPKRGYRLIAVVSDPPQALPERIVTAVNGDGIILDRKSWQRFGWRGALAVLAGALLVSGLLVNRWHGGTALSPAPDAASTLVSLLVLPFENISDDPMQDYFSDGMTEDIITDLSRVSHLRVIASNISSAYKKQQTQPRKIGEKLSVDYVVEGSVRRNGDTLRVNARLVDTRSGFQKWAARYDTRVTEVFSVQDELSGNIVEALALQLTRNERALLARKTTDNLHAYDLFLEAQRLSRVTTRESNEAAQSVYRKAIEADPGYGRAYGALAYNMAYAYRHGWSDRPRETLSRASELARQGVELDSSIPQTFWSLGYVYMTSKAFDKAIEAVNNAIAIAPNYGDGYDLLALIYNNLGESEKAIAMVSKGMELNPYYTWDYPFNLGRAKYQLGAYEEAIESLTDSLERNEFSIIPRLFLAASYVRAGRQADAEWEVEQIEMHNPTTTISHIRNAFAIDRPEMMAAFLDDLRQAGLPE
jgi:adenylate cyclase